MIDQNREDFRQNFRLIGIVVNTSATDIREARNISSITLRAPSNQLADHNETVRKAWSAFSSHFANNLLFGKFGDSWSCHRDRLLKYCKKWAIGEAKYLDDLKETLKDEDLNFIEELTETDPHISLDRLSTLTCTQN